MSSIRQKPSAALAPAADTSMDRRTVIGCGVWLALAGCGLVSRAAAAGQAPAGTIGAALAAIAHPAPSDGVQLTLPRFIEDGSAVPVTVTSDLSDVSALYVLADMNPMPIAAHFRIGPGMAPRMGLRIKLAGSGRVYGAARTAAGVFWTVRDAEVTVGGCG
jgi:predicted secreted protein